MALLESPEDHVPISSSDVTVCRECGGEWPCLAEQGRREIERLTGERDRARDAAAALEAENAELRAALARIRDDNEPTDDERSEADAFHAVYGTCQECWSVEIAAAALARTDPLRVET